MTDTPPAPQNPAALDRLDWKKSVPFFLLHAAMGLGFVTGVKWQWVLLAIASYYLRMFFITAGYHRYFAHRAFQTSRAFQFVMAVMAQSSAQKGVLWWAANHRHHHRFSDMEEDIHSPARRGFLWSHVGWILCNRYEATRVERVRDLTRYPELVWLDRHPFLMAVLYHGVLFAIGGFPWLVWGGFISTVVLWHGTFFINSLTHVFGSRRYATTDTSRNHWLLALLTCGEGWHNNHHFHQNTANQGWFWWEVDVTFYVLKALSWVGVVWGLRLPGKATMHAHLQYSPELRAQLAAQSSFSWRPALPSRAELVAGLMPRTPAEATER